MAQRAAERAARELANRAAAEAARENQGNHGNNEAQILDADAADNNENNDLEEGGGTRAHARQSRNQEEDNTRPPDSVEMA